MPLTILTGRATCDHTTEIMNRIVSGASLNEKQVLLVPETVSHEAERVLCASGGDGISLNAEVLTFRRLATRVFAEAGGLSCKILDPGGRLLTMKTALSSVSDQLKLFSSATLRAEFLSGLVELCGEMKESAILPETLMKAAKESGARLMEKLSELSCIYAAYQSKTANGPLDPADLNTKTAEKLHKTTFFKGASVYVDRFSGFTLPEMMILSEILKCAKSLCVSICIDPSELKTPAAALFTKEARIVKQLERTAARLNHTVTVEHCACTYPAPSEDLAYLENAFFDYASRPFEKACPALSLFSARSAFTECEYIAGEISRLVREEGIRYRDITVTMRDAPVYAPYIETVFEQYGIPYFLSAPSDILRRSVFSFVLSALAAIESFEREPLFAALKTGFTGLAQEETDRLEAYVSQWNIRGVTLWAKDFSFHPDGYIGVWDERALAVLTEINVIRKKAITPFLLLKELTGRATDGKGYVEALDMFFISVNMTQSLTHKIDRFTEASELRLAAEYAQLWDMLTEALSQCAGVIGEEVLTLREFTGLFRLLLCSYEVDTIPVALDQVSVAGMDHLGYQKKKVVFILGCADGMLPAPHRRTGILTEYDRSLLADLGLPVGQSFEELSDGETSLLYGALTHATHKLSLSYPVFGAGHSENCPSHVFSRILSLFPTAAYTDEESQNEWFRMQAPIPLFDLACRNTEKSEQTPAKFAREIIASSPEWAGRLSAAFASAAENQRLLCDPAAREMLGETSSRLSPSKIERYHTCRFSYFMRYGLQVEPARPAQFAAPEIGTFVHFVLEQVVARLSGPKGKVQDANEKAVAGEVRRATGLYIDEVLGGFQGKSARFVYLFNRLAKSVLVIAQNVIEELVSSRFIPLDFELDLYDENLAYTIRTKNGRVSVVGKADRVDGFVRDKTLYLRVVDYKSGVKAFRLADIENGLNLQMLIYLFTLQKKGLGRYQLKCQQNIEQIQPAGILYVPAKEPVVGIGAKDPEAAQEALQKELRRSGLVLNSNEIIDAMEQHIEGEARFIPVSYKKDGTFSAHASVAELADFGRLSKYIEKLLVSMNNLLCDGRIDANPYLYAKGKPVCLYCDYRAACLFDETLPSDCVRALKSQSNADFLKALENEDLIDQTGSKEGAPDA